MCSDVEMRTDFEIINHLADFCGRLELNLNESDEELDEKFQLGVCLDTLTSDYIGKDPHMRCIPTLMEKGKYKYN